MILFVLGRQPEIGIAELKAVFSKDGAVSSQPQSAAASPFSITALDVSTTQALARLPQIGSVVKAAEEVTTLPQLNHTALSNTVKQLFNNV